MENFILVPFLLAAPLLADLLLKAADALYNAHQTAILVSPAALPAKKRRCLLSLLIVSSAWLLLLPDPPPLRFAADWLLSLFLYLVILTDYEQRLIFNRVLLAFVLLSLSVTPWLAAPLASRVAAAFLGGGVMLALSFLPGGIGGGDIKLLFALGLWQGLDALPAIFFIGLIGGGIAAAFLLLAGKKSRRDHFAYGPYFAFAALLQAAT